jgi:acetyl-CoA carboxylase carboxyltransferase component
VHAVLLGELLLDIDFLHFARFTTHFIATASTQQVALDWNTPALNLYKKIGAKVQEGVLTTRYSGEALKSFAKEI